MYILEYRYRGKNIPVFVWTDEYFTQKGVEYLSFINKILDNYSNQLNRRRHLKTVFEQFCPFPEMENVVGVRPMFGEENYHERFSEWKNRFAIWKLENPDAWKTTKIRLIENKILEEFPNTNLDKIPVKNLDRLWWVNKYGKFVLPVFSFEYIPEITKQG